MILEKLLYGDQIEDPMSDRYKSKEKKRGICEEGNLRMGREAKGRVWVIMVRAPFAHLTLMPEVWYPLPGLPT
jgi:hypothetical protein